VHEPLSMLDLLDAAPGAHSWGVHEALAAIGAAENGVIVLLNCAESATQLAERVASQAKPWAAGRMELLTYGIGAQILRDLNVGKMRLMATPRKMPSMAGWDLEVSEYVQPQRGAGAQIA
jgi:3,4-dihydroxy 2-butanone 4-phosphate synthase/GTP cyclohydrolase II